MNKETTQLIEKLANKLGTTSEYLWGVLIKQAPISATTTLVQIILIILMAIGLYRLHIWLLATPKGDSYSRYNDYDEAAIIPMVIAVIVVAILSVFAFFCIDDVINGYFNPEYWALKQLLNK